MFEEYRVANMPSCITWHDGILWVATHNALFKSIMISYEYQDGELMGTAALPDTGKGAGNCF